MTNDGKFVLDGKRVEFSDYGGSSKVSIDNRLDNIEAEIRVLQYSAGKMNEWLSRAEHRVNELQEKIDAID
jgi:hypothetical protein